MCKDTDRKKVVIIIQSIFPTKIQLIKLSSVPSPGANLQEGKIFSSNLNLVHFHAPLFAENYEIVFFAAYKETLNLLSKHVSILGWGP